MSRGETPMVPNISKMFNKGYDWKTVTEINYRDVN